MPGLLGNHKDKLKPGEAILSGACSGIVTRAIVSPFDVIKIRFQLHVGPISKKQPGTYNGLLNAIWKVHREEGIRAFWKGHSSSQLLSIVYGAAQFAVFETISPVAWSCLSSDSQTSAIKPVISFLCGGVSGAAASLLSQPFDTVRTRMIMQRTPLVYTSTSDAFRKICTQEGVQGLYRGVLPNLLQVFPLAGIVFGVYTMCTILYNRLFSTDNAPVKPMQSFFFGACSGLVAKTVVLPFDMTKKRLQVQGFTDVVFRGGLNRIPEYRGFSHCFTTILRDEGFLGFYKGGVPSLLKAFVSTGITFASYNFIAGLLLASREYNSRTV